MIYAVMAAVVLLALTLGAMAGYWRGYDEGNADRATPRPDFTPDPREEQRADPFPACSITPQLLRWKPAPVPLDRHPYTRLPVPADGYEAEVQVLCEELEAFTARLLAGEP